MASSNFPNRPFRLEERVYIYAQNPYDVGNNTLIHSELWIIKNSYSPTWSTSGASAQMFINGAKVGENMNFGYDFRNSDSLLVLAQDNWFQNDGNGNMWITIDGYANVGVMGATEVHTAWSAPRIPRPPGVPNVSAVNNITTNSMGFTYSRGAANGDNITQDQVQWATDAAFTQVVWDDFNAAGYSNPGGGAYGPALVPGKTYYVRVRSRNNSGSTYQAGWGGWSNTGSATTLAALYYSDNAAWKSLEIYVSNGTSWRSPEVLYSKTGVWTTPSTI